MKKGWLWILFLVPLNACGPSEIEIQQTQVVITQTAEWSVKDQYVNCLYTTLDKALELSKFSSACDTSTCRDEAANKVKGIADTLPSACPLPVSCASDVEKALIDHINTISYYVHGPNPNDSAYYQDLELQTLFEQRKSTFDWYVDTLNNSCLRRKSIEPMDSN